MAQTFTMATYLRRCLQDYDNPEDGEIGMPVQINGAWMRLVAVHVDFYLFMAKGLERGLQTNSTGWYQVMIPFDANPEIVICHDLIAASP